MNALLVYLCKKESGNLCMDKWVCFCLCACDFGLGISKNSKPLKQN